MIPLEIERKFLIRLTPAVRENASSVISIKQTYLVSHDDRQRRVRICDTDGNVVMTYTEKKFISPSVREENERIIDSAEYGKLILEADSTLAPVIKQRCIIEYHDQRFEADIYPFSDEYATIELELSDEHQQIDMPPFITVIKEVTGDHDYSNAVLASRQSFPSI